MTPRETMQTIEAATWRLEQEQRERAWLAWHVAALSRAKKLPPLGRLLKSPEAKDLSGDELERRQEEFESMTANWQRAKHGR